VTPSFKAVADSALLVNFADEISDTAHESVLALDAALAQDIPEGALEVVPALVNLMVIFDPVVTNHVAVEVAVKTLLAGLKPQPSSGVLRHVQVCYDGPHGRDLEAVAKQTGLSTDAVIAAHLAGDYKVLMYGFTPGCAYLSGIPEAARIPRKPAAVRDIPAGSVIIAGQQCIVTTLTMPTGWSIIGRSPTPILTGDDARPFLFDVGDTVAFERIDLAAYEVAARKVGHV
jgi:inhibitor of KinA